MKVLAVIPSHNEKNAERVALSATRFVKKVIVIDDGSDFPVLKNKRYNIIRNNLMEGKGYSLKKGFAYAIKERYDIVVILDGDGEHNPLDIPQFLQKLKVHDIVVGQRKEYRSLKRFVLNKWAALWLRLIIPKIEDTQCGFIAIKVQLLKKLILTSDDFAIDLELILESFKQKASIGFHAIRSEKNTKSHVTFNDYIEINNLFDKWVIKNYKCLNMPKFKKILLLGGSIVGWIFGRPLEWILWKHY